MNKVIIKKDENQNNGDKQNNIAFRQRNQRKTQKQNNKFV